jgi:hypothetical protein
MVLSLAIVCENVRKEENDLYIVDILDNDCENVRKEENEV